MDQGRETYDQISIRKKNVVHFKPGIIY